MIKVKKWIVYRWYIRIQMRPVGKSYKHSKYLVWPILFHSQEAAMVFFKSCFTFKNLEEAYPETKWKLSAAIEVKRVELTRLVP